MPQARGVTFIHHRPTKNPGQGAEQSTMTCNETSAPGTSSIASYLGHIGWQCSKHSKIFFTQALTDEDPEQKALGSAWDTWEQPRFPCGWSPVSCGLFLWHIFLKYSHSEHLTLCCKEAGQLFHNSDIFSGHSRAIMVDKKMNARDSCE